MATLPPAVLRQLYQHPLTDKGLDAFLKDWRQNRQSILVGRAKCGGMSKKTTLGRWGRNRLADGRRLTVFARQPDFLAQNPELLASMKAAGAARDGNVFDLQHFKVQRLQSEKERLVSSQRHLIDTARANQSATSQVHTAALAVINAPTFEARSRP